MQKAVDLKNNEEAKKRYMVLTNFVNQYKDKMQLGNTGKSWLRSKGGKGESEGGVNDALTLEDLKSKKVGERKDITLDYEQFMRIYKFEKGRKSTTRKIIMPQAKVFEKSLTIAQIKSMRMKEYHSRTQKEHNEKKKKAVQVEDTYQISQDN